MNGEAIAWQNQQELQAESLSGHEGNGRQGRHFKPNASHTAPKSYCRSLFNVLLPRISPSRLIADLWMIVDSTDTLLSGQGEFNGLADLIRLPWKSVSHLHRWLIDTN